VEEISVAVEEATEVVAVDVKLSDETVFMVIRRTY